MTRVMTTPCSKKELQRVEDIDLETGNQTGDDSLQEQSRRLSALLLAKTEIHDYDPLKTLTPPPKQDCDEEETSGLRYWQREIATAAEHGGDYSQRLTTALRAAMGAFLTFAVLVFPSQTTLGAVWIGNIFMHSNLKDSFGDCLTSIIGFGRSIILTTGLSWPFFYWFSHTTTTQASIALPFVSFLLSFVIMSSPQLQGRNLMILVMYIVVASPVRDDIPLWTPLGWVATYLIGLFIALLVNFVLPNFALRPTQSLLQRLETDLSMLLRGAQGYGDNTANNLSIARRAIASVELLHTRISSTVETLKNKLPAAETELRWSCRCKAAKDLRDWVIQAEQLLKSSKLLKTCLMQRVLGEEYSVYSPSLQQAKQVMNLEIRTSRDRLYDAMITALAICSAWSDPCTSRVVLPDVQVELRIALSQCREAVHRGMELATAKLEENEQTAMPSFAHLTRRMSAFSAIFDMAESLLSYLEKHSWEAEGCGATTDPHGGPIDQMLSWWIDLRAFVEAKWLWHEADNFRLALKTSVGMVVSSLFVSVPYLWRISQPFGVWPGLTIASVNLGKTGSSFHKAGDRLFGTLLAAAHALLVSDLFPGKDSFKIPAITLFTFVVIYFRDERHAYKYTYAATSIGSMLYGSIKNEFDISGYIPKRIELIFVGIIIFCLTELLLFPRSSRKMVESLGFQFFLDMKEFLKEATICTKRMEECAAETNKSTFYTNYLSEKGTDPFHLEKLQERHRKLKAKSTKLSKELDSALGEPNVGLSLALDQESFRGLAREQANCEQQAAMLLDALKKLGDYYHEDGHPIRETNWPKLHNLFLETAFLAFEEVCDWLEAVFPDSRLRAQQGNSVKAVTAAASFRTLEEVRLNIIAEWSTNYKQFVHTKGFEKSDPVAIMTLANSTTFTLGLCRHLQKAGRHLESVTYRFPAK